MTNAGRHEASRGLFATAELLVYILYNSYIYNIVLEARESTPGMSCSFFACLCLVSALKPFCLCMVAQSRLCGVLTRLGIAGEGFEVQVGVT